LTAVVFLVLGTLTVAQSQTANICQFQQYSAASNPNDILVTSTVNETCACLIPNKCASTSDGILSQCGFFAACNETLGCFCTSEFAPFSGTPPNCDACFSGTSTVQLSSGKIILMSELRVGDSVLVMDLSTSTTFYDTVYAWQHKAPSRTDKPMLKICTSLTKTCLSITDDHPVFDAELHIIQPAFLSVGDKIMTIHGIAEITSIDKHLSQGVYSPATYEGTVVVDGIVASNYGGTTLHNVAHAVYAPLRMWKRIFGITDHDASFGEEQDGMHPYSQAWYNVFGGFLGHAKN